MATYALLMIFLLFVGINIYEDLNTEKVLDAEFAEIEYLIDTYGLSDNRIDIKLNSYVSDGKYLNVEMAIKDYLYDLLKSCRDLENIFNNKELIMVINLSNFDTDAPDFIESQKIIADARTNLKNIGINLNELFDEFKILSYAKNYKLDDYYLEYYKNSLIDQDLLLENKEDIASSIDYIIANLDAYKTFFTFLSTNKDYWTMDEEYIYFDTDELLEEYNRLLDIINNIDFTTNTDSYI